MKRIEADYEERGVTAYRCVNAMALSAEYRGNGFAYLWANEAWAQGEWDTIVPVVHNRGGWLK